MKGPKSLLARVAGLAAATVVSTVALVGLSSPAQAVPNGSLGTLTLSPTSGTVADNPMLTSVTTSAACPTGYGTNAVAKVGPRNGPYNNLNRIGSDNNYDQGAFTLTTNRSFTTALGGTAPANGVYEIVVQCTGEILGDNAALFFAEIRVNGANWELNVAAPPTATTTALSVAPAGTAAYGAPVSLTATVAPAGAAGTVEFRRGATPIGSAPVSGGVATLANVTNLPIGTLSLTAVFTPSDATAYAASTSAAVSYEITAPTGGATATQNITSDVAPGAFSLAVAGSTVALTGGVVGGTATGQLNKATVTDLRGSNAGWNLVGQVEDFTGPAGGTILGYNLGWTPNAAKVNASGSVTAGAAANPGASTGLNAPRTLCGAASGSSAGVFECGAALSLVIPDTTKPGSYAATLTLTLA